MAGKSTRRLLNMPRANGGSACGEKAATPLMPNAMRCEVRQKAAALFLKRAKEKRNADALRAPRQKKKDHAKTPKKENQPTRTPTQRKPPHATRQKKDHPKEKRPRENTQKRKPTNQKANTTQATTTINKCLNFVARYDLIRATEIKKRK
jgi:hypothetical protein